MLTIKPPIKLRGRFSMGTVNKDLSEKIMGNYTLMNNFIRKEELLYVTTQTPEVYFAEGNDISIFNDIKKENNQEIKLDIINQLINRILMSQTENFCYQDTVYISNVLRKLGITDVSNFMKQVYRLQEEKRESYQLIDIYKKNKNLLIQIFSEEQEKQSKTKDDKVKEKNGYYNKYYIHEEIYNRLDTGKIYEEIKNFSQGIEKNTKRVYNTEITMVEQISMLQNFNLHSLKNEILNKNEPIQYYHANKYELIENNEYEEVNSESRLSAAILLNLVDGIYSLRINQIERNMHNWYSISASLFQSFENTWKRFEENYKEGKKVHTNMYSTMIGVVNNKKKERNIINNIIKELKVTEEKKLDIEQNIRNCTDITKNENYESTDIEKSENYSSTDIEKSENYSSTDVVRCESYNKTDVVKNAKLNTRFNVNESSMTIEENNYSMELTYLEQLSPKEGSVNNRKEISELTIEHFNEVNRKNIENYKKILEIEQNRPRLKNVSLNKEKARKDMLRALENPEEVLKEYMQSEIVDKHQDTSLKLDSKVYELFSDETKEIFNKYLQQKNSKTSEQLKTSEIVHINDEKNSFYEQQSIQPQSKREDVNQNIREDISRIIKKENDLKTELVQSSSVSYVITESIKNEINELKNQINLYETFYVQEEKVKKKRGRRSKAVIEREKKKERENLELQHFINQAESRENVVTFSRLQKEVGVRNIGLFHKEKEQIITEELINTRSEKVNNLKEKIVEHNQLLNVNRNEKQIDEVINMINVRNQNNIEEIVQQNVRKQLSQITDKVYDRIEKKLQTERKRRGY